MWKLRSLSDDVYKFYIEDTKRGKNASKECVERKLLAMSLVAPIVVDNGLGCKRYQFGTFNFLIRENSDEVGMVYWTKEACFVPEKNSKMLREVYKILGLSEDGQSIEAPINEEELSSYCAMNELTNDSNYRNFVEEMTRSIVGNLL